MTSHLPERVEEARDPRGPVVPGDAVRPLVGNAIHSSRRKMDARRDRGTWLTNT